MSSKLPAEANVGENCDALQCLGTLQAKESLSPRPVKQEIVASDTLIWRPTRYNSIENARGISEEYMAMTKACIHDHDYYSLDRQEPNPSLEHATHNQRIRESGSKSVEMGTMRKNIIVNDTPVTKSRARPRRIVRKSSIVLSNGSPSPAIVKSEKPAEENRNFLSIRDCSEPQRMKVPSPRPSITPFPPVDKLRRNCDLPLAREDKKSERVDDTIDNYSSIDNNHTCNNSTDSAYNSLTCSSTSRPYSANRPPSGGKRSATGGISSSSSSDLSSDECSDVERFTQNHIIVESGIEINQKEILSEECKKENDDHNLSTVAARHHQISRSGRKIRKHVQRSEDTTAGLPAEDNKPQYMPVPPSRKLKKGRNFRTVPMRLRALPTSFWEEPNQTNGSIYTILPPVQPLLHQQDEGDLTDITPVSPVNEKTCRQTAPSTSSDHQVHRPIIKAGDTDLLLRLFDQFDAKNQTTAVRKKRGRSKRPSYANVPPPRTNGQNPCIIDSIADKLFPKLSLDSKHSLATLARAIPRRTPCESVGQDGKLNSVGKVTNEMDEFTLLHSDEDILLSGLNQPCDSRTSSDTSPMLLERPSRILPQLIPHKDYSQLLTELTAVL